MGATCAQRSFLFPAAHAARHTFPCIVCSVILGPTRLLTPRNTHNQPTITRSAAPLPETSIVRHYELVDECFGKATVEEIDAALASAASRHGEGTAAGQLCGSLLAELRKGSPTTLKVGLQMFRTHKGKPLRDVLIADQRVCVRTLRGKDFHEVGR